MTNTLKNKFKSIAILYHIHDEGRTPRECVGHVAPYAEDLCENIDYFFTPNLEFPINQSLDDYDLIFVMGGLGQVFGENIPEWMVREIAMLTDAVHKKKKIIGICLGAQMLALILGAKVKFNTNFECGFLPVNFDIASENIVLSDIPPSEIFWHWHECGFHTPDNAIEIATSRASLQEQYPDNNGTPVGGSQGFVNEHILALQFHPEITLQTHSFVECRIDDTETSAKQSLELTKTLAPIYAVALDAPEENCARNVFYKLMDNFLTL